MTQEELDNKLARFNCCSGVIGYKLLKAEQYNAKNAICLYTQTKYLNYGLDALERYTVPGTILGYNLSVCADIDVTPMIANLRDSMNVTLVIGPPANITLVDVTGNYAGLTSTQFIQVLVDIINAIPGGLYTATNNSPDLTICFNGTLSYNLVGATISIVQPGYWYLKYTSKIARDIPASPEIWRLKGYSAIAPIRPVYNPINKKLYVPNADFIRTIYPSKASNLRSTLNYDFTGVVPGDIITLTGGNVLDLTLSTNFFNNGDPLDIYGPREFSLTFNVSDNTLVNCPLAGDPSIQFNNSFVLNCTITTPGYVPGTGALTFTIDSVTRNSGTTGLNPGNALPAATLAKTCGVLGFPKGAVGGVAIGRVDWTFIGQGTGWGTVSIYDCNLATGALTYNQTIEIPVGSASDTCYFPSTNLVGIVGLGSGSAQDKDSPIAPMCSIDCTADTIDVYNTTNIVIRSIKYNSVIATAYGALGTTKIYKVNSNFNYDQTHSTDQVVDCVGGITYDTQGIPYIAPNNTVICAVKKMNGIPSAGYNVADPGFSTLFTCSDFSPNTPFNINASFDGFVAGTTNQNINVGPNLDALGLAGTNLIWINPQQFSLYHDTGTARYVVTCVITATGYSNISGIVNFDVLTVTKTVPPAFPGTPLTVTTNVSLTGGNALGVVPWTWLNFPYIKGAQDIFLHNPTGRLYITRLTSVGTLLQSYDITSGVQSTILTSKINHYSPGYPTVVLAGPINYLTDVVGQVSADKLLVTFNQGASAYIFDPNTLTWGDTIIHPAAGGTTETGGMSSFSCTGDASLNGTTSQYNFFSSTSTGSELGVVSLMLPQTSQVFGIFDGTAEQIVTDSSINCLDEDEVNNIIENISQICCDCCSSNDDILRDI